MPFTLMYISYWISSMCKKLYANTLKTATLKIRFVKKPVDKKEYKNTFVYQYILLY